MDPGQFVSALAAGMLDVFSWPAFGYMLLGIVAGMALGMIPGLSGLTGMAILLPFAFNKSPEEAMALLLGMYAVTTITDTIPAVLLGVPGTSVAQATIVDGYPMAKLGQAGRALGASYASNVLGAFVAGLIFIASIPIVTPLILSFGAAEFFMLGLLGVSMIGALSGRSVTKGIIVAGLGLLISMIGLAPQSGLPRYSFGQLYLWTGLPLVPAVLGLFGLPELIGLAVSRTSVSKVPVESARGTLEGIKDTLRHPWLVARCAALGAWAGFVPALGGPVAEWFGYSHAVQSAKDKSQFGKGDVRGVIGPESATAGQKPGSLIPTIAFGIPGNASMAILLGAFLIVGLRPGVDMLTTNLDVTFAMMGFIVVANIVAAAATMLVSRQLVRLTFIDGSILIPFMLAFMLVGAIATTGDMADLLSFAAFGVFGWAMQKTGFPRPPMVLGLVLGPLMETYLFIANDAYGWTWLWRPWVLVIWVAIFASIFFSYREKQAERKESAFALAG